MPQTEMNKATRKKKTVALPHTSQMPSRSTLDLQHIVYYLVESKKGFVYEITSTHILVYRLRLSLAIRAPLQVGSR